MFKRTQPSINYNYDAQRTAYFIRTRENKTDEDLHLLVINLHHFIQDFAIGFYSIQRRIHHSNKQRYVQSKRYPIPVLAIYILI